MSQRRQRLKRPENLVDCDCACGHHRSVHKYDPADQGRAEPKLCTIPGCTCTTYRRPAKGERIPRRTP